MGCVCGLRGLLGIAVVLHHRWPCVAAVGVFRRVGSARAAAAVSAGSYGVRRVGQVSSAGGVSTLSAGGCWMASPGAEQTRLQRFTLTCGREERSSIAVSLHPRASIVYDNK